MDNTAIIQGSSEGTLLNILFSNDINRLLKYCKFVGVLALSCCADNLTDYNLSLIMYPYLSLFMIYP